MNNLENIPELDSKEIEIIVQYFIENNLVPPNQFEKVLELILVNHRVKCL